jgi:hypothetical protein
VVIFTIRSGFFQADAALRSKKAAKYGGKWTFWIMQRATPTRYLIVRRGTTKKGTPWRSLFILLFIAVNVWAVETTNA